MPSGTVDDVQFHVCRSSTCSVDSDNGPMQERCHTSLTFVSNLELSAIDAPDTHPDRTLLSCGVRGVSRP